jgi:broad specificity phosphatase PhoE
MTPHLYLVRHGRTAANAENKFAGRTDEPLSEQGRLQVKDLRADLQDLQIGAIYTGPLRRTMQTAEIIADHTVPVYEVQGLIDIDLPHWQGLTKAEIRNNFGDEYPTWLAAPEQFHVKGCEDLHQVQVRAVQQVCDIMKKQPSENILLVTHLIVARCLILHQTKQSIAKFREISVANGEVVTLQFGSFL